MIHARRRSSGFTLIEVLLATVLLAAGLALGFATVRAAGATAQRGEAIAERNERIRAVSEFLRRRIGGVSEKMLAQTLQWLEADGFVLRVSYPVVPPHVEYSLTPLGYEVALRVRDLADWIEVKLPEILQARPGPRESVRAPDAITTHRLR